MNLGISERVAPILELVKHFCETEVAPVDKEFLDEVSVGDRWTHTARQTEILNDLKSKAKALGLWNFFLTDSHSEALSTVEYAYIAEETGKYHLAAEAFNCSAPDTGNMEVLHKYGSEEQKEQWLKPLLSGDIRSAFAMTEPDVASSDATNISMPAVLENGEWVLNGEKWFISGAGDPRCKIMIVMAITDPENPIHLRQSQILVPSNTPGLEILRPCTVMGADDAPHGHMHLKFDNVRVPENNLILGRGRGFEISQGRLGPGRIHHCMRAIGLSEKALEMMCKRAESRVAFGKPLSRLGGNVDIIANARMDIEATRLLTLKTAWMIDNSDPKTAGTWISKIKVMAPLVAERIVNEAIQIHGAAGMSQDTDLSAMYINARCLRLADGPDAVHRRQIARAELRKYR